MNNSPKKRSLPHVWKSFWALDVGDEFFIGKKRYWKQDLFTATSSLNGVTKFTFPWTRYRTTQLVRDARPGGKSSSSPDMNRDMTHFVGDDCCGGHLNECCSPTEEKPNDANSS
jgi:hypothetical protein